MTGIVIRLAGVEQPETRVFHQKTITIGTAPSCDLSFRDDDFHLPASALLLTLHAEEGPYRVTEMHADAQLIRDGEIIVPRLLPVHEPDRDLVLPHVGPHLHAVAQVIVEGMFRS